MPDRLTEIEARRQQMTPAKELLGRASDYVYDLTPEDEAFYAHAPDDIAWLVAEVKRLRGELSTMTQAVGLATTASPTMEMNAADPIGMMQTVCAEVAALREQLESANIMCVSAYGTTASQVLAENAALLARVRELEAAHRGDISLLEMVNADLAALREQLADANDKCVLAYGTNEKLQEQLSARDERLDQIWHVAACDSKSRELQRIQQLADTRPAGNTLDAEASQKETHD